MKKKFAKCDHIDVDWGVAEEEEDIYQTPVVEVAATGTMKKSETTGDLVDKGEIPLHYLPVPVDLSQSLLQQRPQPFGRLSRAPQRLAWLRA